MNYYDAQGQNTKVTTPAQQTQAGRDRYNAGQQIKECQSAFERMGWMLELRAQADANTYAYLSSRAQEAA